MNRNAALAIGRGLLAEGQPSLKPRPTQGGRCHGAPCGRRCGPQTDSRWCDASLLPSPANAGE